jgi:hypothetical protein
MKPEQNWLNADRVFWFDRLDPACAEKHGRHGRRDERDKHQQERTIARVKI